MPTVTPNKWRPLAATHPYEVAEALRERAAKISDRTTAGYLILAAETIEHHAPETRKTRL